MLVTDLGIYTEKRLYAELQLLKMATVKHDMSFVICVMGRERAGKSTIASQMAYILDESVKGDLVRCAFNIKQFREATMRAKELGKGRVVMLDEGGNIFSADDTQQKSAKQIKKIIMMNGKFNIIYILCVPSIFDLTPYMRIHRIDWVMKVHKEVRRNDEEEWEFNKGAYACYSYDQKIKMLMLARYKYDYSAGSPSFKGRFLNTIKTCDIWGAGYEDKKDKAIEDVFDDKKDVDVKEELIKKMMSYKGKSISAETLAKALGYKSKQSVYDLLKRESPIVKEGMIKENFENELIGVGHLPDEDEEE